MDLKDLIAKMDQIEQQPVQLNEDTQQVNEIAPLVLVGAGMGLKWLWDKFTQSQKEAEDAKKAAEDAKRAGDEAEAARLAAEAEKARLQAEEDKRRAEEAYNSKCKEKVATAQTLLSQLEELLKAKTKSTAAVPPTGNIAGKPAGDVGTTSPENIPFDPKVQALQKAILAKDPKALPRFGADGKLGPETRAAFAKYPEIAKGTNTSPVEKNANQMGGGLDIMGNPVGAGAMGEGIIAKSLLESFGYEDTQIDEYSMQDFGNDVSDTARGAEQGLTFGFGNNINAGVKSLWNGTKYKDELGKEMDADAAAQARSPNLYKAGEYTGMAAPFLIPGAGLASAAVRGAGKLGARELAALAAKKAASAGAKAIANPGATAVGAGKLAAKTGLGVGGFMAADAGRKAHEVSTLLAKGGDEKLAQLQQTIGLKPDGLLSPQTKQAILAFQQQNKLQATGAPDAATYNFVGISESKPMSLAESIASLRDRLAEIENSKSVANDVWVYLDESTNTLYDEEGYEILNAEEYLNEHTLLEKSTGALAGDEILDRAAPGLARRFGNRIQSGMRNGWNKLFGKGEADAAKATGAEADAAAAAEKGGYTPATRDAEAVNGLNAEQKQLSDYFANPKNHVTKDGKVYGRDPNKIGEFVELDAKTLLPKGDLGVNRPIYHANGPLNQELQALEKLGPEAVTALETKALNGATSAAEKAEIKSGGIINWIKKNPKKAAAIGLIAAGAAGFGAGRLSADNKPTPEPTPTPTPVTDKPTTEITPQQAEQKILDIIAELEKEPACAQDVAKIKAELARIKSGQVAPAPAPAPAPTIISGTPTNGNVAESDELARWLKIARG
jgi:peptidoglycan hydrolase-like protein with peptidoglycan-binding domain